MISLFKKVNNPDAVTQLLLKSLGISVNIDTIAAELEKHPDYPNLIAVGDVLKTFNALNDAFHVTFDELGVVPCPFIAHAPVKKGDFIVVHSFAADGAVVSNNLWNRRHISAEEFKKNVPRGGTGCQKRRSANKYKIWIVPPVIQIAAASRHCRLCTYPRGFGYHLQPLAANSNMAAWFVGAGQNAGTGKFSFIAGTKH
jgi:hypothetical protein